jgi:hypothetical protein
MIISPELDRMLAAVGGGHVRGVNVALSLKILRADDAVQMVQAKELVMFHR